MSPFGSQSGTVQYKTHFATSVTEAFWMEAKANSPYMDPTPKPGMLGKPHTCFVFSLRNLNLMHSFAIHSVFRNSDVVAHLWLTQLFRSPGRPSRLKRSTKCSLFLIPSLPVFAIPNAMAALEVKQASVFK